jgi:integrase
MPTENRFRFSVERLDGLRAEQGTAVFYDSDVKGLGVRVQPSGKKVFFLLKQVGGRPQRKTLGVVGELKLDAARKHALGLLNQLGEWNAAGRPGLSPVARPEKGLTFSDCFESYVRYLHAPRQKRPIKDPVKAEARARLLCDVYLSKLKPLPVEVITNTRVEELHRTIGKEKGQVSANRAIELLRAVWRYALRKKLIAIAEPTQSVEKFTEKKRKRFLQPDELVRFHKAMEAERNGDLRDFVSLLLATGVRKSSLYAARFDQVSEPLETWTIPETKNGDSLTVQLTPAALRIFQERRKRIGDHSEWVFPSHSTRRIKGDIAGSASGHVEDFKNQFSRLKKAAGVSDITLHDLRRTNASYLAISGASLKIIGDALGHKSTQSTQVYAHLHGDAVKRALLAGEEMQAQMMKAASKQLKAAARRQKSLPAASPTA